MDADDHRAETVRLREESARAEVDYWRERFDAAEKGAVFAAETMQKMLRDREGEISRLNMEINAALNQRDEAQEELRIVKHGRANTEKAYLDAVAVVGALEADRDEWEARCRRLESLLQPFIHDDDPPIQAFTDVRAAFDEDYRQYERQNEAPTVYSHEDPHDGKGTDQFYDVANARDTYGHLPECAQHISRPGRYADCICPAAPLVEPPSPPAEDVESDIV